MDGKDSQLDSGFRNEDFFNAMRLTIFKFSINWYNSDKMAQLITEMLEKATNYGKCIKSNKKAGELNAWNDWRPFW